MVSLYLWVELDDTESLSHGYVFKHLIMPLEPGFWGEGHLDPEALLGLVGSEGSVK